MLPGTVIARDGDAIRIDLRTRSVRNRTHRATADARACNPAQGDAVTLCIRPEKLRLCAPDAGRVCRHRRRAASSPRQPVALPAGQPGSVRVLVCMPERRQRSRCPKARRSASTGTAKRSASFSRMRSMDQSRCLRRKTAGRESAGRKARAVARIRAAVADVPRCTFTAVRRARAACRFAMTPAC